jgi:DNA-binding beta-propeller fold protein YncE
VRVALLAAFLFLLFASPASAHPSRGIAVAPDGQVYYSDLLRVWTIAPNGRVTLVRDSGGRHMHEIYLDRGGALYVEESEYNPGTQSYRAAIWRYRPGGRSAYVYGPTGLPVPGMGVFRDARGCTFQADQTRAKALVLYRLCPGGRPRRFAAAPNPPRVLLGNIGGAAFAPDGSFVFRHGGTVHRLTPNGRLTTLASGFAVENMGIAVDPAGALYVVESERRRILKVDRSGRRSIVAISPRPWMPTGVAPWRDSLFLLEATEYVRGRPERVRVRKLSPGSAPRVLAVTTI